MADDTKNATLRSRGALGTKQIVADGRLIGQVATVEATAAASAASIYTMFRIPATARIMGASLVSFDDLASTGSPTLDFGLKAVDGNITTDDDALNDGVDCATAAGTAKLIKDHANYGKMAWEYVNGQTTNPGGFLDVIITIKDADVNTGGTITAELYISTDR
jgi:hypothetical protein